jgi:hypothetical protein
MWIPSRGWVVGGIVQKLEGNLYHLVALTRIEEKNL